jgi:hypothetical protein
MQSAIGQGAGDHHGHSPAHGRGKVPGGTKKDTKKNSLQPGATASTLSPAAKVEGESVEAVAPGCNEFFLVSFLVPPGTLPRP